MWIFTTGGFVSAVQHRDDHDLTMVRARDRLSLDAMLLSIEESFIESGKTEKEAKAITFNHPIYAVVGDYKWRVVVPKSMFAMFMVQETMKYLNYSNFKSKLTETRGNNYHNVAMKIWTAAHGLTDTVKTGNEDVDNPKYPAYDGYYHNPSKGYRNYDTAADFVGSTFFSHNDQGTNSASEDDALPTDEELIQIRDREDDIYPDDWEVLSNGEQLNMVTGQIRSAPEYGGIMAMPEDAYREMTDAEYADYTEHHLKTGK